jgi:hypothetical protein
MAEPHAVRRLVVIGGDVTIDWNLAHRRRAVDGAPLAWTAEDCTRAYWQRGGAALLADLVAAVAEELRRIGRADHTIRQMAAPGVGEPIWPGDPHFHHAYARWSLFPCGTKPPLEQEKQAWRVAEFLGLDRRKPDESAAEDWQRVVDDDPSADLVVLDDAGLGFRDSPELWPRALSTDGHHPWIVLKMAHPVGQGSLWEHLHHRHAERLIVVMTANDLRLTEVQITRELSWERTAQDLAWELVLNPAINELAGCAHVVISFGAAGALLLSRAAPGTAPAGERAVPRCRLFFDPRVIEGTWEQDHPGGMIGYTTCLAASLARQVMLASGEPDLGRGIQRGLAAIRTLHREGYGRRGAAAAEAALAFPTAAIAAELAKDDAPFAEAAVPVPLQGQASFAGRRAGAWTILADRYPDALDEVALSVARDGAEAVLRDVPRGEFGHLLTVDRQEIEGFRSLRVLIGEYCRHGRQKRPLSIAVFGAPGSGKSFGIIQVAESLLPGHIKVLEFNLSQLSGPDALLDALHQVRDVGLSGQIPLVFWDEFDTALGGIPLGWLRYFLAPMQDGRFQEAQILHPLGRCIFVFAGGTSNRMEDFGRGLDPEEFRAAKGTDFISRLKGYVNILGPNPQASGAVEAPADPYYIIRRAVLLRAILLRDAPRLFRGESGKRVLQTDPGVLRAFLETRAYRHGVRSMEAIIAMSLLSGRHRFERSCLPAAAQLDLHADGEEFLALVQQPMLTGALLERLAQAAHAVFCERLRAGGFQMSERTDEALKTHSALKPYDELPEEEKEQNRGFVRDIPRKLAEVGCIMTSARGQTPSTKLSDAEVERLAELEHERWLRAKLAAGWRFGPSTEKDQQRHQDLLPWRALSDAERAARYGPAAALGPGELPDPEREKDRDLMRRIPKILAAAGYTFVKLREGGTASERAAEGTT